MPDIRPLLRQLDESGADVDSQLSTLRQYDPDFDLTPEEYSRFREKLGYALPKKMTVTQPKPKSINIIEAIRPFVATGANIAGNVAGTALTKNPAIGRVAGLGTAAALDVGLQNLEGKHREESFLSELSGTTPGSIPNKLASTAQMGLENVIGDKILGGLARGAKGVYQEYTKGGVANPLLREVGATFSMYQNRPVAEFIENVSNVFHGKKTEALANINENVTKMVDVVASRLTGRLPVSVESRQKLANLINKQVIEVFERSKEESTRAGTRAQEIADNLPTQVITGYKTSAIAGPAGQPLQTPIFETINGPVYLKKTLTDAYRLIQESPKSVKSPDSMKGILHSAQQLILNAGAKFDKAGNLVSSNPVGFKDAWQFSKDLDELAFSGAKEGIVDPNSRLFKHLSSKVKDDVEDSIPGWANPLQPQSQMQSAEALASWRNAKAIVAERSKIFDRATRIPKMLNEVTSIVPEIDKIIKDPKQLQKTMRLGSLAIPTTHGPIIHANNIRRDLAGYEFQKLAKDAWVSTDPTDITKGHYDKDKLIRSFLDSDKAESYKLLFTGPTRNNIEKLFSAINRTSQSGKSPYASSVLARAGYSGLTLLGTGFIANNLDDPRSVIAGSILTGTLALNGVGRAMSNPDVARLLTSMVEGAPLGMSEKAASKFVLNALQGAKMSLTLKDGTERDAIVTADGKIKVID